MTKRFNIDMIDDYSNKPTEEQKIALVKHCNRYNIKPEICAWYKDWDDFCSDWVDSIGYSKTEARELLSGKRDNKGEFKVFSDKTIVRLVL